MRNRLCSAAMLAASLTCLLLAVIVGQAQALNPWPLPPGATCDYSFPPPYPPPPPVGDGGGLYCGGICIIPKQCVTTVNPPGVDPAFTCGCARLPVQN